MRHRLLLAALSTTAAVALTATGCSAASGASADTVPSVTITSPSDGATVAPTFTLQFASSFELGPTDTGRHHVHVFTDGRTDDYTVVTGTEYQLTDLAPGEHTINVTLQNADHSPAGAGTEITVTVTGDATTLPPGPSGDNGSGNGY